MREHHKESRGRIALGVILILLGAIFITDKFDLLSFEIHDYIFHWPVILIIIGIVFLINSKDNFAGVLLILVGSIFLASDIFYFSVGDLFADFWPLILVLLGLYIIFQRDHRRSHHKKRKFAVGEKESAADFIDEVTIISGKTTVTSKNFKGGKSTTIFGGDIVAIFGGTELIVPADWNVTINVVSIFGGFGDKRTYKTGPENENDRTLVLKGFMLFGGGEIKN
jgi:predicted membrane protein